MWQQAIKRCVNNAVQTHKRSNTKYIDIVLSPDVDGILSSLLISEYANTKGWVVNIVGSYNGRSLRSFGNTDAARVSNALWVDLDVRFNVRSIGQHYLGSSAVHVGTFNPNVFYSVVSMRTKYPFSTSTLLHWALCPTYVFTPIGEAALVHADSAYWVAVQYHKNSTDWCNLLFNSSIPPLFQHLLDGTYLKTRLDTHKQFVNKIAPWTFSTKKRDFPHVDGIDVVGWRETMGRQTCKIVNNINHTSCINNLMKYMANILPLHVPTLFDPNQTRLIWRGTKMMIEPSPYTQDLEAYLQQHNIRSHAITSSRCISVTQGPSLCTPPPVGKAEFF